MSTGEAGALEALTGAEGTRSIPPTSPPTCRRLRGRAPTLAQSSHSWEGAHNNVVEDIVRAFAQVESRSCSTPRRPTLLQGETLCAARRSPVSPREDYAHRHPLDH
jgi:hypothetical protein